MKPTLKQKLFVAEYVKNNGNGTQAALKVYDTKDPKTASVIASDNLEKASVKEQLDKVLSHGKLELSNITNKLSDIIGEEPVKGYSGADIMEAIKTGLKLHGVLTEKRQVTSYNLNADLDKLSTYELLKLRTKKVQETEAILQDSD